MKAAITFGAAAALLTAGLAFVGVEQAAASPTMNFNAGSGNYGTWSPPVIILGTPYSYTGAETTGGVAPIGYVSNWGFPSGLTYDPATGVVSGTDTSDVSGSQVFAYLTATDSSSANVNGFFLFNVDQGLSAMSSAAPTTIDPGEATYSWNGDTTSGGVGVIT
jgi:hypothetical protein